jgi:hypothetical protein
MTTATAQAFANIAFIKYWGTKKFLLAPGDQPSAHYGQKAVHFSVDIATLKQAG